VTCMSVITVALTRVQYRYVRVTTRNSQLFDGCFATSRVAHVLILKLILTASEFCFK
jgi:hypothetical protein